MKHSEWIPPPAARGSAPSPPSEDRSLESRSGALPPVGLNAGRTADEWFTPGRFALLLLFWIGAAYPSVLLGSDTFFFRDYGCFGYPLAHFNRENFWRGELPLWNPLNNGGLPYLAQWNTMTLYPLSALYLLLPLPWSLGFFSLGHLFLGGLGMYFLAQRGSGSGFAASLAGLAYALNGLMQHSVMWPNNIAALGWMPFVVLLVERATQEGGRTVLLAAAVGTLQMLAGAPEIILFTWLIVGVVWIFHARGCGWRWTRRSGSSLALAGLLTLGLAAVQLLPFLDLLAHSQRDRSFADAVWSMPLWGWANFLVPLFHCTPSITGVFTQEAQQWTPSYYVGAGVLVLALWGVLQVRERRVAALAVVALLGSVLALGEHGVLYGWLKAAVPPVGAMRYPIKFVVLTVFALPLLAAMTLGAWRRWPGDVLDREKGWLKCLTGLLLAGMAATVTWVWIHPVSRETPAVVTQNGLGRAVLLGLLIAGVLLLRKVLSPAPALLLRLGMFAVVGIDLLTHMPRPNPTVMTDAYQPGLVKREWNLPAGGGRAMISPRMKAFLDYAVTENAYNFCLGQRQALTPNWNLLEGVPVTSGFYSLYTKEQGAVANLIYGTTNFPAGLADFIGAARISSDTRLFAWDERPTALPLITAGQEPRYSDDTATLRALAADGFDARRVVYLPIEAESVVKARTATAKILSSRWRSHEVELTAQAESAAIVTLAQTHYHWWRATVNGQPARVWPANHAFQAVEIPAGHSVVKLVYEDRSLQRGTLISVAALLGCIVLWWKWPAHPAGERATNLMP